MEQVAQVTNLPPIIQLMESPPQIKDIKADPF